jgi:tRNA 2-thiouridine synthesizing protein C
MSAKVAMLMRKAPYGTVYPAEGFRAMLGIAVFEMDLSVIFLDDGVYTLVKGQDPAALDMKPLGEGFATLPEVGITEFNVHDESLAERGLTPADLVVDARVVSGAQISEILAGCSSVLPF